MDEIEPEISRYYESQQLPPDRVREILAAGRAAAARRTARHLGRRLALAAVVVLGLGLIGGTAYFRAQSKRGELQPTSVNEVADAVVHFFSDPNSQLAQQSSDRRVLLAWLQQHGGAPEFDLPPAMSGLASYGCQVLEVRGRQVYLICFVADPGATNAPTGGVPDHELRGSSASAIPRAKTPPSLVHLLVTTKAGFVDPPRLGEWITLPAQKDWNFTTWTRGDQVFVAAATLPADHLAQIVGAL